MPVGHTPSYAIFVGGLDVTRNFNSLIGRYPVADGMKTGFTEAAGKCLITSYSRDGRDLILVQLGSHAKYIFDDAERMMQWGVAK
jgi:D-alanyl-D-alanine carboxypeptidase (penicillin-binding protein 5/6)